MFIKTQQICSSSWNTNDKTSLWRKKHIQAETKWQTFWWQHSHMQFIEREYLYCELIFQRDVCYPYGFPMISRNHKTASNADLMLVFLKDALCIQWTWYGGLNCLQLSHLYNGNPIINIYIMNPTKKSDICSAILVALLYALYLILWDFFITRQSVPSGNKPLFEAVCLKSKMSYGITGPCHVLSCAYAGLYNISYSL